LTNIVSPKSLCAAAAAYFSARGYFVRRNYKIFNNPLDIVCIMPRLIELKKRVKTKYFVPSGILYTLIDQGWKSTEEIATEINASKKFVITILDDLIENEWVEKKNKNKKILWKLKKYRIPSKDCIIAHCRYRKTSQFLENLNEISGCYNKLYLIFPFPIHEEFMDFCYENGIGILIFYEKVGIFKEIIPPEIETVSNLKVYANISEVIIKENFLYKSIDSI